MQDLGHVGGRMDLFGTVKPSSFHPIQLVDKPNKNALQQTETSDI